MHGLATLDGIMPMRAPTPVAHIQQRSAWTLELNRTVVGEFLEAGETDARNHRFASQDDRCESAQNA
jgi:hypothetical protein